MKSQHAVIKIHLNVFLVFHRLKTFWTFFKIKNYSNNHLSVPVNYMYNNFYCLFWQTRATKNLKMYMFDIKKKHPLFFPNCCVYMYNIVEIGNTTRRGPDPCIAWPIFEKKYLHFSSCIFCLYLLTSWNISVYAMQLYNGKLFQEGFVKEHSEIVGLVRRELFINGQNAVLSL